MEAKKIYNALLNLMQDAISEMAEAEDSMERDMEKGKGIHPATRNRFYFLKGQVEGINQALSLLK